jgi:hypothetical protein
MKMAEFKMAYTLLSIILTILKYDKYYKYYNSVIIHVFCTTQLNSYQRTIQHSSETLY